MVVRATEYEQLLARHATQAQAAFFLETRDGIEADSLSFEWGQRVRVAVAEKWLHLVAA